MDMMDHIKEAGVDMYAGGGLWSDDIDKVWYSMDEQHLADAHSIHSKKELDVWMHIRRKSIRQQQTFELVSKMKNTVKGIEYNGRLFRKMKRGVACSCCGAHELDVFQAGVMDGDNVFFSYLDEECLIQVLLYPPTKEKQEAVEVVASGLGNDMDGLASTLQDFGIAEDVNY